MQRRKLPFSLTPKPGAFLQSQQAKLGIGNSRLPSRGGNGEEQEGESHQTWVVFGEREGGHILAKLCI